MMEPNSSLVLSGSVALVVVRNCRTYDAFDTLFLSVIRDADVGGMKFLSFGGSGATLYGAFPREYSDFLENEEHKNFIYGTLLRDTEVTFFDFVVGTYSKFIASSWRGDGWGIGINIQIDGMWKVLKDFMGKGLTWGRKTSFTFDLSPLGENIIIRPIPGKKYMALKKQTFYDAVAEGNSSGMARVYGPTNPDKAWAESQKAEMQNVERVYKYFWGEN